MAEFVADFLFDAAVEIIPPEGREEKEGSRICLCCRACEPVDGRRRLRDLR